MWRCRFHVQKSNDHRYWWMKSMRLTYFRGHNSSSSSSSGGRGGHSCELSVADLPELPLNSSFHVHDRLSVSGADRNTNCTVRFYRFQVDRSIDCVVVLRFAL